MNFTEAMKALKSNKTLMRSCWKDMYLLLDADKNIKVFQLNSRHFPFNNSILLSEDWIVVKPDGIIIVDAPFEEMIEALGEKAKAKLSNWKDEWIELDIVTKQIIHKTYWEIHYELNYDDFTALDWKIRE